MPSIAKCCFFQTCVKMQQVAKSPGMGNTVQRREKRVCMEANNNKKWLIDLVESLPESDQRIIFELLLDRLSCAQEELPPES